MAETAQDISGPATIVTWEVPVGSSLPRGLVTFNNEVELTAVGAGDTATLTGTFVLPVGYAYLPIDLRVRLDAQSSADISDFAQGMVYQVECDGNVMQRGMFPNLTQSAVSSGQYRARSPALTNDFSAFYGPYMTDKIFNRILCPDSGGTVNFVVTFMNDDGQTNACDLFQDYSFLQYTIEQARDARVHGYAALRG